MELTRKQLLAGGAAALALAGCGSKQRPARAAVAYGLDPALRHFDAFLFSAHPEPVRDAIERHRRGLDAGAATYLHEHQAELERAVASEAAKYLGVGASELAFTDSTTMGLGLVYRGLLGPGDEVLTTEHDHYATHEALRLSGAIVRKVRLYDDPATATADGMLGALREAITPRTKVVALTWVHSGTGVKVPVERLDVAPTVVVDGVHALAAVEPRLAGDVFVAGTHKWLSGPRGTGLIWTGDWRAIAATIPSFDPSSDPGPRFTPGGWHSFEHRWALAEAFAHHPADAPRQITALATQLKDGLAKLPHVRLITPRDPAVSAGIVCFEVDGMDAETVVSRLLEHRIRASVTPYAQQYARLGTSLHVDAADVDAAIETISTFS
ncbi:aminotransferase class V-fold PLP-dependent enzyme [Solirubrobacter ginsenosidimutans]|uniref:Aminotransferase class V-fold PLP-dependent enzyme n=1 Tax=Solirubrobacter ginsenosidimutans TaxID=490573 RepID=A0A9X3N4J3_9ACTN|nr:aminotransferase class V-fold PLP-dependent enzyme [Solirubrobacter ginsenosidimutans]MDA0166968.1 aminotransferase class V-fold PLP-dependent enzyme [Solirubrobacter ginsenosidimutans]